MREIDAGIARVADPIAVGVAATFRIAGPIYRIKTYLRQVIDGEALPDCRLRKGDHLHDLADLFRVLLADARKLVPISAEREISRQYLEIEKLRLGDRLKIKWRVSNNIPRAAQIPALTLQPLLENAIYHGIEPRFAGGLIKIEMWAEGDTLNIMISNPLPDVRKHAHSKGNKIAQDNIRERLVTQFGNAANMQSFEEGGQYHVKLKMPIVQG